MIKYTILTALDIYSLIDKVDEMIKHGWRPQGGVAIGMLSAGLKDGKPDGVRGISARTFVAQVMVKTDES